MINKLNSHHSWYIVFLSKTDKYIDEWAKFFGIYANEICFRIVFVHLFQKDLVLHAFMRVWMGSFISLFLYFFKPFFSILYILFTKPLFSILYFVAYFFSIPPLFCIFSTLFCIFVNPIQTLSHCILWNYLIDTCSYIFHVFGCVKRDTFLVISTYRIIKENTMNFHNWNIFFLI